MDLYAKLVLDSPLEDHGQVEFAALEHFENPDQFIDSVRIANLCNKIKEAVAALQCTKSFTLRDLLRPDKDRTQLFLSALLNFSLYRATKMDELNPHVEELTQLDEHRKQLEDRISQLNLEMAEFNEAREKEMPFVQEVDAKVKELGQIIAGLNNQQMSMRTSFRKIKEKTGEMDEKIAGAEFALVQNVQENANLRAKIVQSPDKLQRALVEKKSVQVEARNAERSAMQSFQEKTAIAEVYTKAAKKMSKHLSRMHDIQELVNSAKSTEKDVKLVKSKLSDEAMLDKSLEAKLVEREVKAQQLDESRSQLEREMNLKFEEATKELNHSKVEAESRRLDLETRQKKVELVVTEVDAVNSKVNVVKEAGASKQEVLLRKAEEVVKELYQYSNSIEVMLPGLVEGTTSIKF